MTPDLILLRSLIRGDVEALRRRLSDPATDATRFLRFAYRHQLGAGAYYELQRLGLADLLPRPVRAATKASSLRERARTENLALLMRELAEAFDAAAVRVLFIKGPLFAERFYGSIAARGVADLDVLIRTPADLARIETLLRDRGFQPAFRVPVSRRFTRVFTHHFEYRRAGLPLDVHWVLQRHFTFAIDDARIWATATRVGLGGRTYDTTSDEYELVLQILGVLTDLQVGKLTLRPLVDIYRILKTVDGSLDWAEFFSTRARERILRPAIFVLALTLDLLNCHDDFVALRPFLDVNRRSIPATRHAFQAVLKSRPLALRQKLLALRVYETPLPAALSWWLLSLPFRLAVYGVTRRRFRPDA
ncbi:MAG TPA: nucleotidyltransferase family protein [Longimicrobiales bacterium]|nr:nucleotidyltransferase family protein [Longimicrobiales bacterium]